MDDRQKLYITIGAPASGKSTWGRKFALDNNIIYLSSDENRAKLGTGEGDQSVSSNAFDLLKNDVRRHLREGKSVIVDATNMTYWARAPYIDYARGVGAERVAIVFNVPREVLIERNNNRTRKVPVEVIDKFINKYQKPTEEEFDFIIDM
jgi:predicted kinase